MKKNYILIHRNINLC